MAKYTDWLYAANVALNLITAAAFFVALRVLGAPVWAATGLAGVVYAVWQTGDFVVRQLRKP